jgi:hypothetical protein
METDDLQHVDAAEGWIELGNLAEIKKERCSNPT